MINGLQKEIKNKLKKREIQSKEHMNKELAVLTKKY